MQLFRGLTRKPPSEFDFTLTSAVLKFEVLKTFLVVGTIYNFPAGSAFTGGKRSSLIFGCEEGGQWTLWNKWPRQYFPKILQTEKFDTDSDIIFHRLRRSSLRDFKSQEPINSKIPVFLL